MNPFKIIKFYLRWKPEIEDVETAVQDAQRGNMKDAINKIMRVVEPILWMVGGGVTGAVADYLGSHHEPNFGELKSVAGVGAITALAAYFRQPRQKPQ